MCMLCPSWLSFILYNPVRKAFTSRRKVLDECLITNASVVLEIGAGNGFFTEAIAERAKKTIAVELQAGMVKKLIKRVRRFGDNIEIVMQDIAAADLGENIADVCLLYYSFHEIRNKADAAAQITKALRHGGILAVYEPSVEVSGRDMEKTVGQFTNLGFTIEISHATLFTRFARLRKP